MDEAERLRELLREAIEVKDTLSMCRNGVLTWVDDGETRHKVGDPCPHCAWEKRVAEALSGEK
jgi:hypothetical protein